MTGFRLSLSLSLSHLCCYISFSNTPPKTSWDEKGKKGKKLEEQSRTSRTPSASERASA